MIANIKTVSRLILLTVFAITVTACGGGGDNTAPTIQDNVPPIIVATKPTSEQIDVKTNTNIEVTFNEAISDVASNQVNIYPYDINGVLGSTRIKLQQDPFSYNTQTKTLTIKPEIDALQSVTKYRVSISDIKDISGNVMVNSCQWEFGTVNLPGFGVGNTSVCGFSPPVAIAPDVPKNVKAIAGNGSVSISWQAPNAKIGSDVTYYKLEKSINNAQNFSDVSIFISATKLSFTDTNAQNGTSHIYRVSAGNDAGLSSGVNSNAVTPVSTQATVVPGAPQNVRAVAGNTTVTITWSAPITGDTVSFYYIEKSVNNAANILVKEKIPAASLSYVDIKTQNNARHIYRVTAGNAIGIGVESLSNEVTPKAGVPLQKQVELISQAPGKLQGFGEHTAFSPDGDTIVIGEYFGGTAKSGTAQIFIRSNGSWTWTQTLNAQTQQKGLGFGFSLAFSQDGSTLAIGGNSSNFVDLYIKSETGWAFSQSIVPNGNTYGNFGYSIGFHPNSTILAIGAYTATPEGITSPMGITTAGQVQLFTKSGSSWNFSQTITSQSPANGNRFGITVKFSPDGSTLAVGELYGDSSPPIVSNEGIVQLFTNNGTKWVGSQILASNNPQGSNYFGTGNNNIEFSPDSNTLLIGEQNGNTVQLFTRTSGNWSRGQILTGTNSNANANFGISVSFSADGNTIGIGEYNGNSNSVTNAGNVYLFTNPGTRWTISRTLTAQVPTANNQFGISVLFNPVTSELAIGEMKGDTVASADAGVVSIIDLSQLP